MSANERESGSNIVPMATGANANAITDSDLIIRVVRLGDDAAFEALVERYYAPALAVARSRLRDDDLAQDVVQETFVRIFRERMRYDPAQPFAAWFYTVLRNIATDVLRRQGRHQKKLQLLAAESEGDARIDASAADCETLLSHLQDSDREILIYHHIHGMSLRQIGGMLRITPEAAKKRAQRAMKRLQAFVSQKADAGRTASGYDG